MNQTLPETPILYQKKLVEELLQGRKLVNDLKGILDKPFGDVEYTVANDLVVKITSLFMGSISMINQLPEDISPAILPEGVPDFYDRKEDSIHSSKTLVFTDKKARFKRRRKYHTMTQITPNLIDDGHAWRKYGQKAIQNAKQPRNYYRCTYKFDQGCQATKQVQRTESEPPMFHVTYQGNHTCKDPQKPQIVIDTLNFNDSKFLISFDQSQTSRYVPTLPNFPLVKQDYNPIIEHNNASFDRHMFANLTTVEPSVPMPVFSSEFDQDHGIYHFDLTSAPSNLFDNIVMDDLDEFWENLESLFS